MLNAQMPFTSNAVPLVLSHSVTKRRHVSGNDVGRIGEQCLVHGGGTS